MQKLSEGTSTQPIIFGTLTDVQSVQFFKHSLRGGRWNNQRKMPALMTTKKLILIKGLRSVSNWNKSQ